MYTYLKLALRLQLILENGNTQKKDFPAEIPAGMDSVEESNVYDTENCAKFPKLPSFTVFGIFLENVL